MSSSRQAQAASSPLRKQGPTSAHTHSPPAIAPPVNVTCTAPSPLIPYVLYSSRSPPHCQSEQCITALLLQFIQPVDSNTYGYGYGYGYGLKVLAWLLTLPSLALIP